MYLRSWNTCCIVELILVLHVHFGRTKTTIRYWKTKRLTWTNCLKLYIPKRKTFLDVLTSSLYAMASKSHRYLHLTTHSMTWKDFAFAFVTNRVHGTSYTVIMMLFAFPVPGHVDIRNKVPEIRILIKHPNRASWTLLWLHSHNRFFSFFTDYKRFPVITMTNAYNNLLKK